MASGRIRHTVAFRLAHPEGSPEERDFLAAAERLAAIPGVEEFELLDEVSPKNGYRFGISMEFADRRAYDRYDQHPDHVRFVQERWLPEVSDFLELDYALPESGRRPAGSRRGFFWIGVERASHPAGTVPRGPMYVQWEAPAEPRQPYPIVLVHGGGGQGLDWLGTPDGRPGWATYLVEAGYEVYVVDRPGHGRASYHPDVLGPMAAPFTHELAVGLFMSGAEGSFPHPTSHLHTQWPGSGELDDPLVDQFVASAGPMIQDFAAAHALEQTRLAELLDRIGPAIVMTHSAGGPAGWLVADIRPDLVKALVAIEPMGPPFAQNPQLGFSLDWGVTAAPITYDPPVMDAADLTRETTAPNEPGLPPSTLQADPARTLPNLRGIPIALVTSPASLLGHSDAHTVAFLRQAGCDVEHLQLAELGVDGNGHLMMLEKNSREVLDAILRWIEAAVGDGR